VVTATGRVVILNGTSSAGKTTLVDEFLARRHAAGECWLTTGIDDFIARLPDAWHRTPGFDGPWADDGFRLERVDDHLVVRGGDAWHRMLAAYRGTVALWVGTGFDVIVDDVALDGIDVWRVALEGVRTLVVGVRCDLDVAEGRERSRGDRHVGIARGQHDVVHRGITYDLELDTTSRSVGELVDALERGVQEFFADGLSSE
jgi:chloramphenicol 3-O phosphotransferase